MKKNFITGLAIILPVVLTVIVIVFFVNLLTKPFLELTKALLTQLAIPYITSHPTLLIIVSKCLSLAFIFTIIVLAGVLGRLVFIRTLFKIGDLLFHRIPLINKVYIALQEVLTTLFREESPSFSQAVIVPFPHTSAYAIGMLVQDTLAPGSDKEMADLVTVFIPATPNPTLGFMVLAKRKDLIPLEMKVDEAIKFIVSCGVVFHGFKPNGANTPNNPIHSSEK